MYLLDFYVFLETITRWENLALVRHIVYRLNYTPRLPQVLCTIHLKPLVLSQWGPCFGHTFFCWLNRLHAKTSYHDKFHHAVCTVQAKTLRKLFGYKVQLMAVFHADQWQTLIFESLVGRGWVVIGSFCKA